MSNIARWKDKDYVLEQVSNDGKLLIRASSELKSDRDVVLKAVGNCGLALQFASKELQNDLKVALKAIDTDAWAIYHISKDLKRDKGLIFEICKKRPFLILYASKKLYKDRNFILELMDYSPKSLDYLEEFQNDKEIVLKAVKQDKSVFDFIPKQLKKDKYVNLAYSDMFDVEKEKMEHLHNLYFNFH